MKTSVNSATRPLILRKGFTLVELLVVIAIIATLAALITAGVTTAIRKARLLEAKNDCVGLVSAVDNFYADHNYLPMTPGAAEAPATTDTAEGVYMLEALTRRGNGAAANTKGTDYFNAKVSEVGKRGLIVSGNNVQSLLDPFGRPYQFIMDADLDNRILDPNTTTPIAARILVWSFGVEGQTSPQQDWVYSWK